MCALQTTLPLGQSAHSRYRSAESIRRVSLKSIVRLSVRRDNVASLRPRRSAAGLLAKKLSVLGHGIAYREASAMDFQVRGVAGRGRQQSGRAMDDQKQGVVQPHVILGLAAELLRQASHQPF